MDWQDEIEAAVDRITGYVVQTPIMMSDALWDRPLALKLEHMQHTGSFKARGAFNTLLASDVPPGGVVAASGGNHGAAVAYAAKRLGHNARVFVPELAGPAKIALIERTGAELTVVPGEYADALAMAQRYEAEQSAMQIHAYDAPLTVSGQGTLMQEWLAQGLEVDTILIAVGGGGLIGGSLALGYGPKIVGVEPMSCATLFDALQAGAPVDVSVSGVAANALGARRIGSLCFDLAVEKSLEVVKVPDGAILEARDALWQAHRMLVEPAGACALAALRWGAYVPEKDERLAVLVCGANPAPDPLMA